MQVAGSVSISGILDRVLQRRRWAHIVETRRDGVFRAICCVALLAKGAGHSLRNASCSSSRKTAVAAPRDLIRGSLEFYLFWKIGLFAAPKPVLLRRNCERYRGNSASGP